MMDKYHASRPSKLVVVPITLISCILIGFVAVFVVPMLVRRIYERAANACINNLRQIDGAKEQWALENHITNRPVSTSDIQPYMGRGSAGTFPICPAGGQYIIGKLGEDPRCTIGRFAWPNDHVLNDSNNWWTDFKSAYAVLLGFRKAEKP
jgi:hypothetical protein